MALTAREQQIIESIEQQLVLGDPRWAARCERLWRSAAHRTRRRLTLAATVLAWIALVSGDAANTPGPWLWTALAASAAALALLWLRRRIGKYGYRFRRPSR
jgi:hypothetical protein